MSLTVDAHQHFWDPRRAAYPFLTEDYALAVFDCVAVSGALDGRVVEYVDHLHHHFVDPVVIRQGHYRLPVRPGFSAQIRPGSLARYRFPDGRAWRQA